jgi:lipopolysaccharide export LptBFGC system permease protein LptF
VTVLDRYVIRLFAVTVFVAFTAMMCLYVMVHFFGHLEDLEAADRAFESRGIGLVAGICRYYAVAMPFTITRLGPFAALLAAMWTVQKLARDQEIAAAQVAGVSLHRMTAPILIAGAVLSLGLWAIRQQVLPRLAIEHNALEWLMRGKAEALIDRPPLIHDSKGNRFSIQTYDPGSKVARNVNVRNNSALRSIDVPAMRWDEGTRRWEVIVEGLAPAPLPVDTDLSPRDIEVDARGLRFLSGEELDELARRLPGRPDLELMQQTRFSYPLVTVVLLLLGLPLVLQRDRQSNYAAWGLCLLLSILYFGLENVLYGFAERDGLLSPVLAAWIPIVVFGTVGAMAFQDL